jgi:hypothetical protein
MNVPSPSALPETSAESLPAPYGCTRCGRSFQWNADLRVHIEKEHGIGDNAMQTAFNEEVGKYRKGQREASAADESTGVRYPCKVRGCMKVFGHRSSRCRHEKAIHRNLKKQ